MDGSGESVRIEKLDESNYSAWKKKLVPLPSLCDIDKYIENDPPFKDDGELNKWQKGESKARVGIGLSLSNENLENVRDVKSPKHMWKKIITLFELHTLLKTLSARQRFYTVTMKSEENMLTCLTRFRYLAVTLNSMGVDVHGNSYPRRY